MCPTMCCCIIAACYTSKCFIDYQQFSSLINMHISMFGFTRLRSLIVYFLAASALLTASVTLADIVYQSSVTAHSNDVTITQLTVNKPSSVAQGDLMLANIAVRGGTSGVVTPPSGWTEILRTDN